MLNSPEAPSPHEILHWERGNQWAVRQGPWKLMHQPRPTGNGPELTNRDRVLINLEQDIGETTNVADEHPDIVERLEKRRFLDRE